jgi:shikimate dehydrogenase
VTRRVALIGKPLRRRHSQVMHDAAFDAAGIDGRYVLMEIEPEDVIGAVAAARGEDWLGLGVTAPYKRLVATLVDEVEPDAEAIGAVNNVVRTDDGRLVGFNSDAPGFRAGVELAMGRSLAGASVAVAGAGGAAHAIVHACVAADARRVTIGNRSAEAAGELATRFGVEGGPLDGPEFEQALESAEDIAVNATTVGMVDPDHDRRLTPPGPRDGLSTSSTSRPRPPLWPPPGPRPARGERLRDAESSGPRSRSSAGPASVAWPT